LRDWHATLELVSLSVTPVAQRSPVSWRDVSVDIKVAQDSAGDSCVIVSPPILGHLIDELLAKFTRLLNIRHNPAKLKLWSGFVKGIIPGKSHLRPEAITLLACAFDWKLWPAIRRARHWTDEGCSATNTSLVTASHTFI
jgi:hypothetical protein